MNSFKSEINAGSAPKALSPVEERLERLVSAQDETAQSLDHLLTRLAPVLRDGYPSPCGSCSEHAENPESPLVVALDDRVDAAQSVNFRIVGILQRLTI